MAQGEVIAVQHMPNGTYQAERIIIPEEIASLILIKPSLFTSYLDGRGHEELLKELIEGRIGPGVRAPPQAKAKPKAKAKGRKGAASN